MVEVIANDKVGKILVDCRRSGWVVLFHRDKRGRISRIVLSKDGVHSLCDVLASIAWENIGGPRAPSVREWEEEEALGG
jgi:hypothetical protein